MSGTSCKPTTSPRAKPLEDEHFIEAEVPVSLLAHASEQPGVIVVKPIVPPQPAQFSVGGQGATAHGAIAWHSAGYRGQGVKVGVIDLGFQGFSGLQGSELPSSVQARCYTSSSSSSSLLSSCAANGPHGTAVTEVLYETAPGASFYISRVVSKGTVKSAVQWMVSQGVDVITTSVHWLWDGPGNGTFPIHQQSSRERKRGSLWRQCSHSRRGETKGGLHGSEAFPIPTMIAS